MRKRITVLIAALMLALTMAFGSVAAFAASPAEEACDAGGGEFVKTGPGQFTCIFPPEDTNPGNPQSDNFATPKKSQTSKTQTGQGGGAGEERSERTCVYNNAGKLQENRSDPGCPATPQ